jgi:predicted RNA-binding protein with PUA-like domain
LDAIKADDKLDGMMVRQRGARLSIQPVEAEHYWRIVQMGRKR